MHKLTLANNLAHFSIIIELWPEYTPLRTWEIEGIYTMLNIEYFDQTIIP